MAFAAGVILTSHPETLERAFSVAAPYMPKAAGAQLPDNSRISTQWTRRMNSLKLWLTLRVHGRQAYEELIDCQLKLGRSFVAWVKASENFELAVADASDRHLSAQAGGRSPQQLTADHDAMVDEVTRDGGRWISETKVRGERAAHDGNQLSDRGAALAGFRVCINKGM